MGSYR